jgi:hypothetical protein
MGLPTEELNFGEKHLTEVSAYIKRYGSRIERNPQYVLIGAYNLGKNKKYTGILSVADNEFHAYILRRELRKHGYCDVERTEHHEAPTFSMAIWKQKMIEKMKSK